MTDLKLGKLPDRTPVKLTITVTPGLNRALHAYAELYREAYGQAEPVTELIPYMLEAFLASDRGYGKALRGGAADLTSDQVPTSMRGRRGVVRYDQSAPKAEE